MKLLFLFSPLLFSLVKDKSNEELMCGLSFIMYLIIGYLKISKNKCTCNSSNDEKNRKAWTTSTEVRSSLALLVIKLYNGIKITSTVSFKSHFKTTAATRDLFHEGKHIR